MNKAISEIKCYPRTIEEYQASIRAEEGRGRKISENDGTVTFIIDCGDFKNRIMIFPPKG